MVENKGKLIPKGSLGVPAKSLKALTVIITKVNILLLDESCSTYKIFKFISNAINSFHPLIQPIYFAIILIEKIYAYSGT